VKSSKWLNKVSAITEKPKVTMARNQAFNRTQVNPIKKPIPADKKPPIKMPIIGGTPNGGIASKDEVNPPIPKKAACPSDPCPEVAKKFQLEAYIEERAIKVRT
jgi:hypothetical protein